MERRILSTKQSGTVSWHAAV